MYAYINGLVIDKNEKTLIVLAQNIGYKITVPTDLLAKAQIDQKIQLFLYTAVREGDISLYGFAKREEQTFYEQLLSVSGIGPKTAMDIISAPIHMTQQAIVDGDTAMLTKIKGLGKKTAERLILELKNKVVPINLKKDSMGTAAYNDEAVQALVSLGYEKYLVVKTLSEMPANIQKTEEIVKYFLKKG
jgi:holliday junction DNA helicase RuvA